MLRTRRFSRLAVLSAAFVALTCGAMGCSTVEYYEKQYLQDPAMQFETDASEVHFQQKVFYSMEGSAGGIGESGGGGCGCY